MRYEKSETYGDVIRHAVEIADEARLVAAEISTPEYSGMSLHDLRRIGKCAAHLRGLADILQTSADLLDEWATAKLREQGDPTDPDRRSLLREIGEVRTWVKGVREVAESFERMSYYPAALAKSEHWDSERKAAVTPQGERVN